MNIGILLAAIAGSATLIGALAILVWEKPRPFAFSMGLAFCSGAMLFISLVEFYVEGREYLLKSLASHLHGGGIAHLLTLLFFLVGWSVCVFVDKAIHHLQELWGVELEPLPKSSGESRELTPQKASGELVQRHTTPHEPSVHVSSKEDPNAVAEIPQGHESAFRVALVTAIAIAMHNFPEGIITYASTLADRKFGFGVALAIAMHNIPEGFAVAWPVYYSQRSYSKAFALTAASGFAEPLGAICAWIVIGDKPLDPMVIGLTLSVVGGIMSALAVRELMPSAVEHCPEGASYVPMGVLAGIVGMASSMAALEFVT